MCSNIHDSETGEDHKIYVCDRDQNHVWTGKELEEMNGDG
jgi:hypothetical protein